MLNMAFYPVKCHQWNREIRSFTSPLTTNGNTNKLPFGKI